MAIFADVLPPVKSAWNMIAKGASIPQDHLLIADAEETLDRRIIWLEKLRQYALSQEGNLLRLEPFEDFQELVGIRRPEPTLEQWLWLYTQIGARRWDRKTADTIAIMAGRDALLPFLASIPDKRLWDLYGEEKAAEADNPLPYLALEEAIQADTPAQVSILKVLCHNIPDERILARAIKLQKVAIVTSILKKMPLNKKIESMIKTYTDWPDPIPLFHEFAENEDEIAAWRDSWGNGFFWYLYRRPVLSKTVIENLPPNIVKTFSVKNGYGISPENLWIYYRPVLH